MPNMPDNLNVWLKGAGPCLTEGAFDKYMTYVAYESVLMFSYRLTEKSHAVASMHLNLLFGVKVGKARHGVIKRTARFTHTQRIRKRQKEGACMSDKWEKQETGKKENKGLEQEKRKVWKTSAVTVTL